MVAKKFQVSERAERINLSVTFKMNAQAKELAKNHPMLFLGLGEPDFPTPDYIKEAAIAAIHNNETHYTAVAGTVALREAIQYKMKRDSNLDYALDELIASTGAKQSIAGALAALLNKGDEVLLPAPYWVSYPEMIRLYTGEPISLSTTSATEFKITPEQLEAAITPKTKLLMLNSPSNPTGMLYTREELTALGEVLLKHPHVYILSDDIYEHITWTDKEVCNIVMACPALRDRTVIINGVSKAYAMTGWRLGFAAGPKDWITAISKIQSQVTTGTCSITQAAAAAALKGSLDHIQGMVQAFKERAAFFVDRLQKIDGFDVLHPDGAFYAFPDTTGIQKKLGLKDDMELADYLINEQYIATTPGTPFGSPNHIRFSFASSMDVLEEALQRLEAL